MQARNQPLALVLLASTGAQVAVLPAHGAFRRYSHVTPWPSALLRTDLLGRNQKAYPKPFDRVPPDFAIQLFVPLVQGANKLVDLLTDPSNFTDAEGVFKSDERWITWTSVLMGLEALHAVGESWTNGDESLWAAFRSLDILSGIWEGQSQGSVRLRDALDPEVVNEFAVSRLPAGSHQTWGAAIVDFLKEQLTAGFAKTVEEGIAATAELRNLVHGVGAQGTRPRGQRLEILRRLDRVDRPQLHTIRDVVCLWWTAAILSPETNLSPGTPPWLHGSRSKPASRG